MKEARGLVQPLGFWLTTFEGDKMSGNVKAGAFGSFPWSGERG